MKERSIIDRAYRAVRNIENGNWFLGRRPQFALKLINQGKADLRQCLCEAGKVKKRARQIRRRSNQQYPKVIYLGDLF